MYRRVLGYMIVIMVFLTLVAFIPLNASAVSSTRKASITWASIKAGYGSTVPIEDQISKAQAAPAKYKNFIYPRQSGDPGYGYIYHIQSTGDGLALLLDWNGLKKGLISTGAAQLANWTAQLYRDIPEGKILDNIGHLVEPMTQEINYHCIAYFSWPWVRDRANPVNIRFRDYYWGGAGWWAWLVN